MEFFATTGKGVEELLAGELRGLGIADAAVESGGVRFTGDVAACWRANLWLRTANRVLMPLAVFPVDSPQALYDGVRAIGWTEWLTPDMTLAVDCNLRDSAMTHSGFVALKTKDAIVDTVRDACGRRPNVEAWRGAGLAQVTKKYKMHDDLERELRWQGPMKEIPEKLG